MSKPRTITKSIKAAVVQQKDSPGTIAPEYSLPDFQRAVALVDAGKLDQAFNILGKLPPTWPIKNAMAVIHIRQGKLDAAIGTLRAIVLQPGCVWMREGIPAFCRLNFATALLLSGNFSGAVEIIQASGDENCAQAQQLRGAIKGWLKTQSLWKRLDWRLNGISHTHGTLSVDFVPGVIGPAVATPNTPAPSSANALAAAAPAAQRLAV